MLSWRELLWGEYRYLDRFSINSRYSNLHFYINCFLSTLIFKIILGPKHQFELYKNSPRVFSLLSLNYSQLSDLNSNYNPLTL